MNDIVSSSGPSDKFKHLFHCDQKIDSNQVTLVYDFFQRILLDKEVVPKILVLKYILEFFDGNNHQKKDYDSTIRFSRQHLYLFSSHRKRMAKIL